MARYNNYRGSLYALKLILTGAAVLGVMSLSACGVKDDAAKADTAQDAASVEAEAKADTADESDSTADTGTVDIIIDENGDARVEMNNGTDTAGDGGNDSGTEANGSEAATADAATAETKASESDTQIAALLNAEYDDSIKEDYQSNTLDSLKGIPAGTVLADDQIDWEHIDKYFTTFDIEEGDSIYERINGKSYRANDYVPLSSLIYLKLPHYNFNGEVQVGEIIVCRDIIEDVKAVFKELFESKYQIESMYLVDKYWTGNPDTTDSASIDVNNTSSFCYRNSTGGGNLSQHAYGRAIDINPQQNPYVSYSTGSPQWSHSNADAYIDRGTGLAHVITHDDLAYKVFTKYGFTWGGDWTSPKDYQHFQKKK